MDDLREQQRNGCVFIHVWGIYSDYTNALHRLANAERDSIQDTKRIRELIETIHDLQRENAKLKMKRHRFTIKENDM